MIRRFGRGAMRDHFIPGPKADAVRHDIFNKLKDCGYTSKKQIRDIVIITLLEYADALERYEYLDAKLPGIYRSVASDVQAILED